MTGLISLSLIRCGLFLLGADESVTKKLTAQCETGVSLQPRAKVFYYFPRGKGGIFGGASIRLPARQCVKESAGKHISGTIGIHRFNGLCGHPMQRLAVPGYRALSTQRDNEAFRHLLDGCDSTLKVVALTPF
jgi:hypothetical protein